MKMRSNVEPPNVQCAEAAEDVRSRGAGCRRQRHRGA